MSKYNNFSTIPFYGVSEGEDSGWDCRKWYAWGQIYPLVVPRYLMPFFIKAKKGDDVSAIDVYQLRIKAGTEVSASDFEAVAPPEGQTWANAFRNNGLKVYQQFGWFVFMTEFSPMLDDGFYYLKVTTTKGDSYVSEIFKVQSAFVSEHLTMEWRNYPDNSSPDDIIPYFCGFKNRLEVESTLGMPEYEFEEEGEKRMGYFYPTKQISYKKYKFTFIAPEYLCDVLRLVPMSDDIIIWDADGVSLSPTDFSIDFEWLEQGHYAKVNCEFTTDTVVKKIGISKMVKDRSFGEDFGNDFGNDRQV